MTDDQQRARELSEVAERSLRSYVNRHVPAGPDRVSATLCIDTLAALRAAPEGPATHYHCKDGIHGTVRRLRRYSTTAINRNSLQGQTMEEAAAFIEHMLAARPQGVKDGN